jgi:hypothetical protein
MNATPDDLCVTCNDRDGVVRRLDIVARGDERRQYELVLCGVCTDAFDDADLTTVEAPTDSRSPDR